MLLPVIASHVAIIADYWSLLSSVLVVVAVARRARVVETRRRTGGLHHMAALVDQVAVANCRIRGRRAVTRYGCVEVAVTGGRYVVHGRGLSREIGLRVALYVATCLWVARLLPHGHGAANGNLLLLPWTIVVHGLRLMVLMLTALVMR